MNARSLGLSDDIVGSAAWATLILAGISLLMLLLELRRRERGGAAILLSGLLATALCGLAVLRPVVVEARTSTVGARVVLLVDQSLRMALPATSEQTRYQHAVRAASKLTEHYRDARLTVLQYTDRTAALDLKSPALIPAPSATSDLVSALNSALGESGERPDALVVVSDGRLSRPAETADDEALKKALGAVTTHTVRTLDATPADASIRSVRAVGVAVAHQTFTLTIEVGCEGVSCTEVPVVVRELRDSVPAAELAAGKVKVEQGVGKVELEITLDRAGARVVQVEIETPPGDTIPENNSRYLTFDVARDRVRLLHLAGRPTHDVRALRMWLERDQAVDVVAFFILRGTTDNPNAGKSDLALIEFPVNELFTEHLPSFDAVILQDIDAIDYKLDQYLLRLSQYVKTGGGLIMVGGPASFAGGDYAGTPLDEIFPIEQPRVAKPEDAYDGAEFEPVYTPAGQAAAVTLKARELLDNRLPRMAGANLLGRPRPGSIVLWEHPTLKAEGRPMPVLALGEAGDGRAIALGVDSTSRLAFGSLAASVSGRAYGALWDGLLGWLMRDPRYEAARVQLEQECVAGYPTKLRVTRLPGMDGDVTVELKPLLENPGSAQTFHGTGTQGTTEVDLGKLEVGGYTAKVRVGEGPPTRRDFGCEKGGEAWSDSRPDPTRLRRIAQVSGGKSVAWDEVESLPPPQVTEIVDERRTSPILPPWGWTLSAALMLGTHWVARRRGGLV
jgi:uncharacterized membrane protein